MRTRYELEVDEDGEVTLVTRQPLGHVSEADPDAIPAGCRADFEAELAAHRDAQRHARGCEAAAGASYDERFGSFGGALLR